MLDDGVYTLAYFHKDCCKEECDKNKNKNNENENESSKDISAIRTVCY